VITKVAEDLALPKEGELYESRTIVTGWNYAGRLREIPAGRRVRVETVSVDTSGNGEIGVELLPSGAAFYMSPEEFENGFEKIEGSLSHEDEGMEGEARSTGRTERVAERQESSRYTSRDSTRADTLCVRADRQEDIVPRLYHGTSDRDASRALTSGLTNPRLCDSIDQARERARQHSSVFQERPVVLEVVVHEPAGLQSDHLAMKDPLVNRDPEHLSFVSRHRRPVDWRESLRLVGSVTFSGTIPPGNVAVVEGDRGPERQAADHPPSFGDEGGGWAGVRRMRGSRC